MNTKKGCLCKYLLLNRWRDFVETNAYAWWSSSEYNDEYIWGKILGYDHAKVYRNGRYKACGQSVCCIKFISHNTFVV